MRYLLAIPFFWMATSCAVLHHVQLADVEAPKGKQSQTIEIKVSETGINLEEAGKIIGGLGRSQFNDKTRDLTAIIGLFQMGPRTGNTVFVSTYARSVFDLIYDRCPSGQVSNLTVVRETRKYPVISGEIIKISGNCWL